MDNWTDEIKILSSEEIDEIIDKSNIVDINVYELDEDMTTENFTNWMKKNIK